MYVLCGGCVTVEFPSGSFCPLINLAQLTSSLSLFSCRHPVLQEVRTVPFLENHLSHCWRTEPASCNELYWRPTEKRLLSLHGARLARWFRDYLMGCICCRLSSWLRQRPCYNSRSHQLPTADTVDGYSPSISDSLKRHCYLQESLFLSAFCVRVNGLWKRCVGLSTGSGQRAVLFRHCLLVTCSVVFLIMLLSMSLGMSEFQGSALGEKAYLPV